MALVGEYDISNDVVTPGSVASMFVYIRARFRLALIGGNLTAQSTESHRGIESGIHWQLRDNGVMKNLQF